MSIKRTTSLLVASVFCSIFSGSIASSQSNDVRCTEPDSLIETLERCDDANAKKKLNVDPAVTNSVKSSVSNNTTVNDNAAGNDNSAASSNSDGTGADVGGDVDHDNGHGNDADHDDASNPGQGGGNHGADK